MLDQDKTVFSSPHPTPLTHTKSSYKLVPPLPQALLGGPALHLSSVLSWAVKSWMKPSGQPLGREKHSCFPSTEGLVHVAVMALLALHPTLSPGRLRGSWSRTVVGIALALLRVGSNLLLGCVLSLHYNHKVP